MNSSNINSMSATLNQPQQRITLKETQSVECDECKNTTFTINAYDTTAFQTPLYRIDGQIALCSDLPCTPGVNSESSVTININAKAVVNLANADSFHDLVFDKATGIYRVEFQQPTILANEIGNLTIQSAPLSQ